MRRPLVCLALAALCACAPAAPLPPRAASQGACNPRDLSACESRISEALRSATDTDPWVSAYLEARASALGAADGWVDLWGRLGTLGTPGARPALVFVAPTSRAPAIDRELSARAAEQGFAGDAVATVPAAELAPLSRLRPDELLLAIARKRAIRHLAWSRGGDVVHALGRDPLAPFVFALPAVWVEAPGDARPASLASGVALAAAIDRDVDAAVDHLGALRYAQAAALVQRIGASLESVPVESAAGLRGRWLLGQASLFGAAYKKPGADDSSQAKAEPPPDASALVRATQGAYACWLRVLLAKSDDKSRWSRQRSAVSPAISAARLEVLDGLYGYAPESGGGSCEAARRRAAPEPFAGELLLASSLPSLAADGTLSPAQWARAYEATVANAERSRAVWFAMASLLQQRGELPGVSTRGSALSKRVTRLAVEHVEALARFQREASAAYQPAGQLSFALLPGANGDPEILGPLHRLLADNVRYKLAPASAPKDALGVVTVLALSAMMLPDPVRGAYLAAVAQQLDAKLHGELERQAGWEVAALYGLGALGPFLMGRTPDLGFTSEQMTRALEARPDIQLRPLAILAARVVQYAALLGSSSLEADRVAPAALGPGRRAARARLLESLRSMAAPGEAVPPGALEQLTTVVDGLVVTAALAAIHKDPQGDKACKGESKLSAPVRKNLEALRGARDALLREAGLRDGKGLFARRARLLVVALSDAVDLALAPPVGARTFAIEPERAAAWLRDGLGEWVSAATAEGVASAHTLARVAAGGKDAWKTIARDHGREIAGVLRALTGLSASGQGTDAAAAALRSALEAMSATAGSKATPEGIVPFVKAFYGAGLGRHADVALLVGSATGDPAGEDAREALRVAEERKSPVAWMIAARRAVALARPGEPFASGELARALRSAADDKCNAAQVDDVVAVADAVGKYSSGDREAAARALDEVLARAESRGLVVPRVQYQFDDVLESGRGLKVLVHASTGQGFISENALSIGFDVFGSAPRKATKVETQTNHDEDAARYYVNVAATAAVYHFVQGHDALGALDAERALEALGGHVRLGAKLVRQGTGKSWGVDAVDTVGLLAELALRRGQPLLAADLVRALPRAETKPGEKPSRVSAPGDGPAGRSLGIRILGGQDALIAAADALLAAADEAAACGRKADPPRAPDAAGCDQLRRGIALWRAGAYSSAPKLRPGGKDSCADERALLDVLHALEGKRAAGTAPAEPDLAKAAHFVATAAAGGRTHEALVVLRLVKQTGACPPGLADVARRAARKPHLGARLRVDWLTFALECPGRFAEQDAWDDLELLAEAAGRLDDAALTQRIDAAIVRIMVQAQQWGRLARFVHRPELVEHMDRAGPVGAATALLLQHAADVLDGRTPDLRATKERWEVTCVLFGDAGREPLCRQLGVLRNRLAVEKPQALADIALGIVRSVTQP